MSLTRTKRNNPCQICEDTSGKCRQSKEDSTYWQCMTYVDAKKGEIVGSFKCIGQIKNGLWAAFKPDNSQNWTEQQRAEWQLQNQQRQQQKAKVDDERRRRSLSVAERDKGYRQMLDELTLHPNDRADLVKRGFTAAQIELSGFRSIGRYQQLQGQYSELLPGVNRNSRIVIREEGYLCPIRNQDGFIVACQVRLRTLPSTKTNRYRWLSGDSQTLHLFPDGCKSEGELPLAVFKPEGKPEGIALVEGTGAKPFLVSQRLSLFTIGAAGGQLASSPELVEQALQSGTKETNLKTLLIFPDAGDIVNRHIMTRWQKVVELVESLGYEVKFAWWDQVSKGDQDIDELKDFSTIRYISPDEFFQLGQASATTQGFGISGDTPNRKCKTHGVEAELALESKLNSYQQTARNEWKSRKTFTAIHKINPENGYFSWEKPPQNSALFVKSGLGTGKTTWLRELIESIKDGRWMSIGYRNTLLIQFCADRLGQANTGMIHIHDKDGLILLKDTNTNIAFCADSILKFQPEDFDDCNLIFDEFVNILRHIQTSPTIRYAARVLSLIGEAVKRSKRIICLDGNMADWAVDWIRQIDPSKQIVTVENINKKAKAPLTFLTGAQDEDEKIKPNDNSPFSKLMFAEGAVPIIGSDSQVRCEALDKLFTELGKSVLRVDSKTISMSHVKEFLEDCDAYIKKHKPDVVIYSPSAESGVDISIEGYFTHHICLFFGALTTDSQLQMTGRVRDASVPKYVWCREKVYEDGSSDSKSPLANQIYTAKTALIVEEIAKLDKDNLVEYANSVQQIIASSVDYHYQAWSILSAIYNYEKANLRDCLLEQLRETGYQVNEVILETEIKVKEKVKEMTKEVKINTSEDIFNAEQIPINSNDEARGKFDATWEERAKEIQASYRKRLPGIENTDSWTPELIYKFRYGNPKFITQCETFWFFMNQEVAQNLQIEKYRKLVQSDSQYQPIGRFHSPYAICKALEELGVRALIESKAELTNESPEVKEMVRKGKMKKIADTLGKYPGKDSMKYVNSVLSIIGLGLKKNKKKVDGETVRFYKIDEKLASDPDRKNALKCLEKKWTEKMAETTAEYRVDQVALCTNSLIKPIDKVPPMKRPFSVEEKSQEERLISEVAGEYIYSSKVEELVEAFEFADSLEVFESMVEGESQEDIQDAIALAPSIPLRSLLRGFYESIYGQLDYLWGNVADRVANAAQGNCGGELGLAT